ncbi:MAG: hypothetical protein ABIH72_01290 [archaeon]
MERRNVKIRGYMCPEKHPVYEEVIERLQTLDGTVHEVYGCMGAFFKNGHPQTLGEECNECLHHESTVEAMLKEYREKATEFNVDKKREKVVK